MTREQLEISIQSNMPTNGVGFITAEHTRQVAHDLADYVDSEVEGVEVDVTDLDNRMTQAETDIDNLETRMDTAEGDIDSLEGRVGITEQDISQIKPVVAQHTIDINNLDGRMDTAEDDIDALETRVDGIGDDVTGLDSRVDTLEDKVDVLEPKVDQNKLDIDNLKTRVTQNGVDINSLDDRMDAAEGDINNIEDDVDMAQRNITNLQGRMQRAEGDIQNIEANHYTKTESDGRFEQLMNKTTDFTVINDVKYPTTKAVADYAYKLPDGGIPKTDLSEDVQESLDKADTAIQEEDLVEYAKVDGYYEGMGVGTADNLTGQTERTDDKMYRKSGGSEEVASGTATITNIKGQTVVWNQLYEGYQKENFNGVTITLENGISIANGNSISNPSSVVVFSSNKYIIGHKYLYIFNTNTNYFGTWVNGILSPNYNSFTKIYTKTESNLPHLMLTVKSNSEINNATFNSQLFDLTLIYGAGNEPSTVTQFEADYFKWFGKPFDYDAYDTGSLRSVQLDSLKTTGFNQYNNGQAGVIGGLQYQITGTYTGITLNDEVITPDANGLFTPSTTGTLIITGGGNDTCIHISGDRNGEYEPYEEHSVSLPVTTITGKLNGEGESVVVFPDGMKSAGTAYDEIYTVGDKTYAVKRITSLDLGEQNYTYNSVLMIFSTNSITDSYIGVRGILPNACSPLYTRSQDYTSATTSQTNNFIANRSNNKGFIFKNTNYNNVEDFKTAMQGVPLYYELETPLVYELDTFDLPKPYQVDSNGTEEQIQKSGVQGLASILTCIYGVDAVKILDKLPQKYISEASMDNFLAQLNTVTRGTWTKTWNDNTGEWDFSFTPNAQNNDINTDETI